MKFLSSVSSHLKLSVPTVAAAALFAVAAVALLAAGFNAFSDDAVGTHVVAAVKTAEPTPAPPLALLIEQTDEQGTPTQGGLRLSVQLGVSKEHSASAITERKFARAGAGDAVELVPYWIGTKCTAKIAIPLLRTDARMPIEYTIEQRNLVRVETSADGRTEQPVIDQRTMTSTVFLRRGESTTLGLDGSGHFKLTVSK